MKTTKLSGIHWGVAAGLVMALPQVAQAEGFWQARGSLSLGLYNYEEPMSSFESDGDLLAGDLGGTVGLPIGQDSTLIVDVELELIQAKPDDFPDFDRTDLKVIFGLPLDVGLTLSPFAGIRIAQQGDGFFNDDLYSETGFVLGAGLSGIKLGESQLAFSIAYNDSTYDWSPEGRGDQDASGYSLKASYRLANSPLAFSIKYQYFDAPSQGVNAEFNEDYLLGSATWYFAQGAL